MKKYFGLIVLAGLTTIGLSVHALSFGPDTIFLDASNENECSILNGSFIEWYEESYCTTIPTEVLTSDQQEKIALVASKIMNIIGTDDNLYKSLMISLEGYKAKFMNNKDTKRLSIAILLIQDLEIKSIEVPNDCSVWFDGCNTCQVLEDGNMACGLKFCATMEIPSCIEYKSEIEVDMIVPKTCSVRFDGCNDCQVMNDGELACTRMACAEEKEARCKVHQKTIIVADHTVECVGVGPMTCLLTKEEGDSDFTYFYDSIDGFDYQEGYEYTLVVSEEHKDLTNVPADASSISRSLVEIQNKKQTVATESATETSLSIDSSGGECSGHTRYVGSRGGCYYMNSSGNKTYGDRSCC